MDHIVSHFQGDCINLWMIWGFYHNTLFFLQSLRRTDRLFLLKKSIQAQRLSGRWWCSTPSSITRCDNRAVTVVTGSQPFTCISWGKSSDAPNWPTVQMWHCWGVTSENATCMQVNWESCPFLVSVLLLLSLPRNSDSLKTWTDFTLSLCRSIQDKIILQYLTVCRYSGNTRTVFSKQKQI